MGDEGGGEYGEYYELDHAAGNKPSSPLLKTAKPQPIEQNAASGGIQWNKAFQEAYQTSGSNIEQLHQVCANFVDAAKTYAEVIIREHGNPHGGALSTKDLGGIAGGLKFIPQNIGILFKLCEDRNQGGGFVYGRTESNYELAAKAAGHELRGTCNALQACHATRPESLPLTTTMMCVVDFLGLRATAMPELPIPKKSAGLCYGSADAGKSVKCDPAFHKTLAPVAKYLHLAEHYIKKTGTALFFAGDVEAHRGDDDRWYLLDLARLFPAEAHRAVPHLPARGNCIFYRLLRPELLARLKQEQYPALSGDTFSSWSSETDHQTHAENCKKATEFMLQQIIPELAKEVDLNPDLLISPCSELHRRGINMRHMGLLRHLVTAAQPREVLLIEMISRTIKNMLRKLMRDSFHAKQSVLVVCWEVARFLNRLSFESCWAEILEELKLRFGYVGLTHEERDPVKLFRAVYFLLGNIMSRLFSMTGVRLKTQQELKAGMHFTVEDLELGVRIKHFDVMDWVSGQTLFRQAEAPELPLRSRKRLYQVSSERFDDCLKFSPGNLQAQYSGAVAELRSSDPFEADKVLLAAVATFRNQSTFEDLLVEEAYRMWASRPPTSAAALHFFTELNFKLIKKARPELPLDVFEISGVPLEECHFVWAKTDSKDRYGNTPLIVAARLGYSTAVAKLIQAKADVNAQNFDGRSALHERVALVKGDDPIMHLLLENGADPNLTDQNGRTSLHLSSSSSVSEKLLTHGGNPKARDKWFSAVTGPGIYLRFNQPDLRGAKTKLGVFLLITTLVILIAVQSVHREWISVTIGSLTLAYVLATPISFVSGNPAEEVGNMVHTEAILIAIVVGHCLFCLCFCFLIEPQLSWLKGALVFIHVAVQASLKTRIRLLSFGPRVLVNTLVVTSLLAMCVGFGALETYYQSQPGIVDWGVSVAEGSAAFWAVFVSANLVKAFRLLHFEETDQGWQRNLLLLSSLLSVAAFFSIALDFVITSHVTQRVLYFGPIIASPMVLQLLVTIAGRFISNKNTINPRVVRLFPGLRDVTSADSDPVDRSVTTVTTRKAPDLTQVTDAMALQYMLQELVLQWEIRPLELSDWTTYCTYYKQSQDLLHVQLDIFTPPPGQLGIYYQLFVKWKSSQKKSDLEELERLCGVAKPSVANIEGSTSLMKAAELGLTKAVEHQLQLGANPEAEDIFGRTALDYASTKEVREILANTGTGFQKKQIPPQNTLINWVVVALCVAWTVVPYCRSNRYPTDVAAVVVHLCAFFFLWTARSMIATYKGLLIGLLGLAIPGVLLIIGGVYWCFRVDYACLDNRRWQSYVVSTTSFLADCGLLLLFWYGCWLRRMDETGKFNWGRLFDSAQSFTRGDVRSLWVLVTILLVVVFHTFVALVSFILALVQPTQGSNGLSFFVPFAIHSVIVLLWDLGAILLSYLQLPDAQFYPHIPSNSFGVLIPRAMGAEEFAYLVKERVTFLKVLRREWENRTQGQSLTKMMTEEEANRSWSMVATQHLIDRDNSNARFVVDESNPSAPESVAVVGASESIELDGKEKQ